ncbi:hypothetical protein Tco_0464299 [Tanacetum coccineum]
MSHHKKTFVNPFHTKKIFANMKREGKDFSRKVTPLFDSMLVQVTEEVGEDSSDSNCKSDQGIELLVSSRGCYACKEGKFEDPGLTSFKKLGTTRRIKSSNAGLGAQEDASKQGRSIEDINADAEVTLVNKQQNEDLMFDTGVLDDDEVFVDVASTKKNEQSTKLDDSTAGEVTAAKIDELTLAQTLIEIKAAKPKVVTTATTTTTTTSPKESDEVEEVSEDDKGELLKHLVIKKDKDIAIDAIPLATKLLVIFDYKLHKEGMLVHYQLIRADRSSKRYSSMIRMLQGIDREDLEVLRRIVKAEHNDTRPEDDFKRVLWGDLKVMFKPDTTSDVWRMLQGYRSKNVNERFECIPPEYDEEFVIKKLEDSEAEHQV